MFTIIATFFSLFGISQPTNFWLLFFAEFMAVTIFIFVFIIVNNQHLSLYQKYLPKQEYNFDHKQNALHLILMLCILALVFALIIHNMAGFYIDHDSMSVQLKHYINGYVVPQIWGGRYFPLSHTDSGLIYILFNGFHAIKFYLIVHLSLVVFLVYKCFYFIPVDKRLLLISLFLICPPIVNIYASPIYSERNIVLLLLSSFYLFQRYYRSPGHSKYCLVGSMVLLYESLFFKEPTVVYVASFSALMLFARLYNEKHYLKPAKEVVLWGARSLEFLIQLLCFSWYLMFFASNGDITPEYRPGGLYTFQFFLDK